MSTSGLPSPKCESVSGKKLMIIESGSLSERRKGRKQLLRVGVGHAVNSRDNLKDKAQLLKHDGRKFPSGHRVPDREGTLGSGCWQALERVSPGT